MSSMSAPSQLSSSSSSLSFLDPSTLTSCTPNTCPIATSFYNYRISLPANIVLLVLFALEGLAYIVVWATMRSRRHFFNAAMFVGCVVEVVGYAARVWAWWDQWDETAYLMQIICLTLAPAFFSAGVYVCVGDVVQVYGEENSRLKAAWYSLIFIPCDIIALLLQAVGGGMSASALAGQDLSLFQRGNDILTAGLAWQVFTLFCFVVLCVDLGLRVRRRVHRLGTTAALEQSPSAVARRAKKTFRGFLVALAVSSVLIFWRCVYRLVELNAGFTGPVTFNQGLFIGMEGVLIVVAAGIMAAMHPGWCLGSESFKSGR